GGKRPAGEARAPRARPQRPRSFCPGEGTPTPSAWGSWVIMEPGPPQYPPRYPPRDGPGYQRHRPGTAGSLNAPRGDLARSSPVSDASLLLSSLDRLSLPVVSGYSGGRQVARAGDAARRGAEQSHP